MFSLLFLSTLPMQYVKTRHMQGTKGQTNIDIENTLKKL